MTVVTSTMRMQLLDDGFTANASKVAAAVETDVKRINELKAALKETGASQRLQASLEKLGASTTHVDGVRRALEQFKKEQGLVTLSTKDMTDDQRRAMRTWESVTTATVRAVIKEEKDATAAARVQAAEREAIAKREAEREVEARIRAGEREKAALQRQFEAEVAMRHRHDEQMRHAQDRAGFRHFILTGAAAATSAHGVVSAGERVLEAGAEQQHERVQMGNAGISPAEIIRIQDQSLRLSAAVGNVSQTQIMETAKELRSVITDPEELGKVLDPVIRAKSVLDAMDTTGASSEGIAQLLKAGELVGAGQDPERLTRLIDGWVRVMQVSGKTVNPEQIFEFVKYSKTAGAQLSDRFLTTVGPSILQELGGSTTGNDIAQMSKTLNSGFQNKHSALREMARIGMINLEDIDYLKTGEAKGLKPGAEHAVRGDSLFQTDPDKWVYEVLLPHLEAAGMKTTESQLSFVQKAFSGTAADFIAKTITQRQAYDTHAGNYALASGIAGVGKNAQDASVGVTSLSKALENLSANVSEPIMAPVGIALNNAATWINNLAQIAKDHPIAAPALGGVAGAAALGGAGWLSYQFMNGFGLGMAATELKAAATAQSEAAAAISRAAGLETAAAEAETTAAGKLGTAGLGGTGGKASAISIVANSVALFGLAKAAEDSHIFDSPKRGGIAGLVELLDPGLADRIYGRNVPESRTKDDIYVSPRTSDASPDAYWEHKKAYLNRGSPEANPLLHKSAYITEDQARALPVSLTSDSSAAQGLTAAVAEGTYRGFRRVLDERIGDEGGSGVGGGFINASYETGGEDGSGGGSLPNLRYNRQHRAIAGHQGRPGIGGGDATRRSPDSGRATRARGRLAANQQEAYRAAIAEGLSPTAARAIVANMSGESLANPHDYHWDRTHMSGGIVQWDPARSARIKEHFGQLPWEMSVADQTRAAIWEMRTRSEYGPTNRALQGNDPNAMIGALVRNYERPADKEKAIRERLGYLHGFNPEAGPAYADETLHGRTRAAETAVLPRRPITPHADDIQAMNGEVGFDHSGIREAVDHVRTLKAELASLGSVGIDVKHHGFSGRKAPPSTGAVRTALNGNFSSDGRWS